MELSPRIESWRGQGEDVRFRERRIHVHRRDGDGPLLLLLHGFPSSAFDWRGVLERTHGRRALAFDFLGFGLSEKPAGHEYTLAWQADLAEELVRQTGPAPVFVVAHDMGTSVATELMARDLRGELGFDLAGVLLFNGSILLDRPGPRSASGCCAAEAARCSPA